MVFQVMVKGFQLLETMKACNVTRIINAATAWQNYEDAEYNPVSLYAATKEAFEDILRYYTEAEGFDAISLAIFDSYGPGDNRKKLIHTLEDMVRNGGQLDMSPGEQEMDMVYIDDIIDDFIYAAEMLLRGEEHDWKYYIRSGNIYTLKKIVEIFEKVFNANLEINWGTKPYREREVMRLARRGKVINPDVKRINLEEGFRRIKEIDF